MTGAATVKERRLDRSLILLDNEWQRLSDEERTELSDDPGIRMIETLCRLRGMEMTEEVMGMPVSDGVADLYDRMVEPGQPLIPSLLRVAQTAISGGGVNG